MNDTETVMFRLALKSALEREFANSEYKETTATGLKQFDRIIGLGRSASFAFEIIHNCIASEQQTAKAIQSIKDVVQSQLDALNKTHKGIERNSKTRLKAAIEAHSKKARYLLDNCLIDGKPLGEVVDIDSCLPKMPEFLKSERYTATASVGGKPTGLEMTVVYVNGR